MDDEHVRQTKSLFQSQIRDLDRQMAEKKKIVNGLCSVLGEPAEYPDAEPVTATNFGIQSDAYFRKPLATAVRDVLERRKAAGLGAAPLDEIYELMKRGGFVFEARNDGTARRALAIALSKNLAFIRLPNDDIGLSEWYGDARGKSSASSTRKDRKATTDKAADDDDNHVSEFHDEPVAAGERLVEAIAAKVKKG